MKRFFTIIALSISLFSVAQEMPAQTESESVLSYSLPKTELKIQITAERLTQKPGQFYQYSERYLATTDVITTEKTFYRMKGITITPQTKADPKRTFKIIPSKNSLASHITVNDKGILCGINVPVEQITDNTNPVAIETEKIETKKLLPLDEEYMMAGSEAKMAEGIAKQIYRIREGRVDMLAGEADSMPKDGESMKTMIIQMDEQEKELTELFTGKTTVEPVVQIISYSPDTVTNADIIFRFSSFNGISSKEDLSGAPYSISIEYTPLNTIPAGKKTKGELIYTIIPVTAKVKIEEGTKLIYEQEMDIPQLGVLMPISTNTMDKKAGKMSVSPVSGRLLLIQ